MSCAFIRPPSRPPGRGALRGATLAELLVYCLIFALILGFIYSCLILGLDAYRRTESFATLQQQAMAAMRQVSDELASSPGSSVRIEPNAVVLLSAKDAAGRVQYDAAGAPLWQAWVLYTLVQQDGRSVLRRFEKTITPVADPPEPVPSASDLRNDPQATQRTVAQDVVTLDLTGGTGASLRLVATTADYDGSSIQLLDRVHFRP